MDGVVVSTVFHWFLALLWERFSNLTIIFCTNFTWTANIQKNLDHQSSTNSVNRQVHALLEVKKLSTSRTLIDYAAFLSSLFVVFLWIKARSVGIASVPAFDLCLLPVTLVWLVYAAAFQGDLLPHTGRTVTRRKAMKFCFVGCTWWPVDYSQTRWPAWRFPTTCCWSTTRFWSFSWTSATVTHFSLCVAFLQASSIAITGKQQRPS